MTTMSNWLNTKSFNKKDEYYTPSILVNVIEPFIPKNTTVWCPFDTAKSEFVKILSNGRKVIHTHVWEDGDFFSIDVPKCDYIVSNPPFTKKLSVLERLYKIDKPFAMVLGLPILNYQEIGNFFLDKPLQLLIVDKKVSFDGNTASFNNSFFCNKILPKDIMFSHLKHNNSGDKFIQSQMIEDLNQQMITISN